jgi:hypothetical protein
MRHERESLASATQAVRQVITRRGHEVQSKIAPRERLWCELEAGPHHQRRAGEPQGSQEGDLPDEFGLERHARDHRAPRWS